MKSVIDDKITVKISNDIPEEIRNEITELYQRTMKSSLAFVYSLYERCYRLVKSLDIYMIIDESNNMYDLSKAAGVEVCVLQETLKNYSLDVLSVEQTFAQDRELEKRILDLKLKRDPLNMDVSVSRMKLTKRQKCPIEFYAMFYSFTIRYLMKMGQSYWSYLDKNIRF
ncbi:MAG TPA: hypothetical protein DDZ41_06575 [Flavobacterium sp.]|nr:hypothetical protein [Flavobacterium sp.]